MLYLLATASISFATPGGKIPAEALAIFKEVTNGDIFSHPGYVGALEHEHAEAVPPTACSDTLSYGRCVTDLSTIKWTAPNPALPEEMRGVFMDDFDGATGFENPNYAELLDYNMFQPYEAGHRLHGSFWVKQTTSHFWIQGNASYNNHGAQVTVPLEKYFDGVLIATPHDEIGEGVWQFSYAFGGGGSYASAVNVIDTFTSHKISDNVYKTEWYHLGKLSGSWPTVKVKDATGKNTDQWDKYVPVRYPNNVAVTWP